MASNLAFAKDIASIMNNGANGLRKTLKKGNVPSNIIDICSEYLIHYAWSITNDRTNDEIIAVRISEYMNSSDSTLLDFIKATMKFTLISGRLVTRNAITICIPDAENKTIDLAYELYNEYLLKYHECCTNYIKLVDEYSNDSLMAIHLCNQYLKLPVNSIDNAKMTYLPIKISDVNGIIERII